LNTFKLLKTEFKNFKMKAGNIIASWYFLLLPIITFGQTIPNTAEEEAVAMIKQIYTEVSGQSDEQVDWDKVRSLFVKEAVIVLQTSQEESTQMTLEDFIQDFKDFYASSAVGESGFKEVVLRVNSQVYKDMASIGVVYEASILDSERPPQKGIDFWLLQRMEPGWKIIAVTNQIILPGEEIPGMFDD
jgi:hypothetical protein